jgi:hypothetical protein
VFDQVVTSITSAAIATAADGMFVQAPMYAQVLKQQSDESTQ